MKGWIGRLLLLGLLIGWMSCPLFSQGKSYKIDSVGISIVGESTLHDWTVVASEISDFPVVIILSDEDPATIENFTFKVKVASMDGGRGSAMNNKIFKALKSTDHPNIEFSQSTPVDFQLADDHVLQTDGLLSIAGITKNASVSINCSIKGNNIVFSGKHIMKMSEYGIDPPSAMFGQIQTKDDIAVLFTFRYKKG